MPAIVIKNNNLEFGLKRCKTETAKDGILSKAREREFGYKKPGEKRREEKKINTINSRKNSKNRNKY